MRMCVLVKKLMIVAAVYSSVGAAYADDYRSERDKGRKEVSSYFNKQVAVRAALVRSSGPEWTERFFNVRLFGCPTTPVAPAEPTKDILFTTAGPGPWAGAVDGINTVITTPDGVLGGGFAVPSNSTARLPEDLKGPELQFRFDGTLNLRRALVDAAVPLPPGNTCPAKAVVCCESRWRGESAPRGREWFRC